MTTESHLLHWERKWCLYCKTNVKNLNLWIFGDTFVLFLVIYICLLWPFIYSLKILHTEAMNLGQTHAYLSPPTTPKRLRHIPLPLLGPPLTYFFLTINWIKRVLLIRMLSDLMAWSCGGSHRCRGFVNARACHGQKTAFQSPPPHLLARMFFLSRFLWCSLGLGVVGDIDVLFRAEHSLFSALWPVISLCFDY